MEVKNTLNYDFEKSFERLDGILSTAGDYTEKDTIPGRNELTFTNGYYLNCYAVFVDIRESSQLPQKHTKPVLAKIYRCYISEIVAIMQSYENCKEVNIVGDCVSGIFMRGIKDDVLQPFNAAAHINSLVNTLNYKLKSKSYETIKIGIGIAVGKALMIKAGYSGSSLNDVVWMGDVVNEASNLCNIANKQGNEVIVLSEAVYNDLSGQKGGRTLEKPYQEMLTKTQNNNYTGNLINIGMDDWLKNKQGLPLTD